MGLFNFTKKEKTTNKILKMNQDDSNALLNDREMDEIRKKADDKISSTRSLLKQLGIPEEQYDTPKTQNEKLHIDRRKYSDIESEANERYDTVEIEDILTAAEIQNALNDLSRIEQEFSQKTSIFNKQDLIFLSVATALQTAKALFTPWVSQKLRYGNSFDPADRVAHNDKEITRQHNQANRKFRDKYSERYGQGCPWLHIINSMNADTEPIHLHFNSYFDI